MADVRKHRKYRPVAGASTRRPALHVKKQPPSVGAPLVGALLGQAPVPAHTAPMEAAAYVSEPIQILTTLPLPAVPAEKPPRRAWLRPVMWVAGVLVVAAIAYAACVAVSLIRL